MSVQYLLRGAITGAIAGIILVLTFERVLPLLFKISPFVGIFGSTMIGAAMFGMVLGVGFSGVYEGSRRLVLHSLVGWAVAGLAFCGLVFFLQRTTQSLLATFVLASAITGGIGGAGFGLGWGGRKGALYLGLASLVGFPLAMFLGWQALIKGAVWLDASGIDVANRLVVHLLADLGYVLYGGLVGLIAALCEDEEDWSATTAVAATTQSQFGHASTTRSPSTITDSIHAGTREGIASGSSGQHQAVSPHGAVGGIALAQTLGVPTAPSIDAADALEFDDSDVALTPYEESNPGQPVDDSFDMGSRGGRHSGQRNLHPDYAQDVAPPSSIGVGIGGLDASVQRPIQIEVDLDEGAGTAPHGDQLSGGDDGIEMEHDDEYGFLDED